ncbi:MAG: hypothetical protein MUE72_09980 [Chitinophagaceae bacterium]|jgi:hypothetical protein|nr:hypothetical protein [Chitinophagaceae bacterium]
MNLSSKTTYLFPFLLLLIPSLYFIHIFFGINTYSDYLNAYLIVFIESSILAMVLYFALRKAAVFFSTYRFLKYFLILVPSITIILVTRYFYFDFLALIVGLFLFSAFSVFSNRYTAVLTDETIDYKNLFGESGQIDLKDIVKLEQKKNILSIFTEFKILDLSRKTGITFTDENLDEYEINFFAKAFKSEAVFSSIIDRANKCGNLKIRQYTI